MVYVDFSPKIIENRKLAGDHQIIAACIFASGGKSGHFRAGWPLTVARGDSEKVPQKINRHV